MTIDNIDQYFKDKFADADSVLQHRESTIDWWLTGIAIGISILTILFSLVIFFIGKGFYKEIKHEKENLQIELEQFKKDFRRLKSTTIREARELKSEANRIIEELKSYRTEAQILKNQMADLIKISDQKDEKLNENNKQTAKQIAKSIEDNIYASECQKLLASAYDCYYSDNYKEAIIKYLMVLKNYTDELTVSQLCSIYHRIGFSYLEEKDYKNSINYFSNLLNIDPNDYNALCNIGLAYQNLGEKEDSVNNMKYAMEYYEKALNLKTDDWLYSRIASIFVYNYDYKTAIEKYDKALSINNDDDYLFSKIECLIFNNELENAEELLNSKQDQTESFETNYLKSLIEIIRENENSADDIYKRLRQYTGTKIETTNWDFLEFERWLDSDHSNFLSTDSRNLLLDLNKHFIKWTSVG